MNLTRVKEYCSSIGISNSDKDSSIRRLIQSALIENDLRAQKFLEEAQAVRITPTGRYYLCNLYRMFSYIDLVMQDTPLLSHATFKTLESLCESSDMKQRFERCDAFIEYLADQEEEEMVSLDKLGCEITWRTRFVPRMRGAYEHDKKFIINKGYLRIEEEYTQKANFAEDQWRALDKGVVTGSDGVNWVS